MTFQRILRLVLCLAALLGATIVEGATKKKAAPASSDNGSAKGAIIMDASTGAVLFEKNADVVSPPASMTKLMSFAVIYDKLCSGAITLQTPVTVDGPSSHIGGTRVWLREHEVFPVEDLIYAMMIQSANDAAYAMSKVVAGSPAAFVELMNQKARELGMMHTTFRSPHGLPPTSRSLSESDLTSPRDYALLARYLLTHTDVLKYTSVRQREFGKASPLRKEPVMMTNHNHLLGHVEGVDGLKTGFTGNAGFCLTATAQRNGHRIIVVVMDSPNYKERDSYVIDLLELGFSKIPANSPNFVGFTSAPATPSEGLPFSAAKDATQSTPGNSSDKPEGEEPMVKFSLPGAGSKK